MFSKEQFIESIAHETEICKHLFTKLPQGSYDYRPTPGQRSVIELLRYLAIVVVGPTKAYLEGNWESGRQYGALVADMPPEEFPAAMDRQMADLRAALADLTEEDMTSREVTLPTGVTKPLGGALVNTVLKWIVGYRMQLFLYAKGAGADEIGTSNCWGGVDRQPRKEEAAAV